MDQAEKNRFDELYQRHLRMLKLQGKSQKAIDAYSRAVRRISSHFDYCPDQPSLEKREKYFSDLVESQSLRWPGSFGRRRSSLLVVQLPKGGVNGRYQLVDSTIDGLLHSRRLVAHHERLEPGETSLKEAALILLSSQFS